MFKLIFGATLVSLIAISALGAGFLTSQDPQAQSLPDRLEPPSAKHWLGRDENGTDVWARLVYGSRVSLMVALAVVTTSVSLGLIVGSFAGFFGKWADQLLMRITDLFFAFPGFLIALSLVALLGPSLVNLIFAMCVTSWAGFARLVRGEVLHLKEREYVLSARALGAGPLRLLVRHIWPNLAPLLAIQASFAMAGTIISESSLSFLGLGVPSSVPTWGALLNSGRRVMTEFPHISFAAGIAIVLLVTGFNFLGEGLRECLDPRRGSSSV